ncbi:hypothetical protein FNH05_26890 [Amycolatopsis rhizosphaerae]|uniref:Right-handed parallel beta-helix repeat-containing protein n=1 Tax=Amycolatopsis rhizosphaerae TaxID=2053003 RepID=A0A558BBP2_9PSEU|nr:hypothetical protein [Amycolatopsis rhizosphaerae]TVT33934.1 hypothetical protein FNH05_26890 [Amycolatopsis rhizosphaerae]
MRRIWMAKAMSVAAFTTGMATVPATAHAATIAVPCDSAALISAIVTSAPGGTLVLAPGCTYTLDNSTGPIPVIDKPLTIHGNDSTISRDPGSAAFRILSVNSNVNIDRINLTGGAVPGSIGAGITVFSGLANLNNVHLYGNVAASGGGLGVLSNATVRLTRSTITQNRGIQTGGGLSNTGQLAIGNSVINENEAGERGGGIINGRQLIISDTALNNNVTTTPTSVGGGIG